MEYSHFHPTNSFPAESEDFIFTSHGIYTYKLWGLPGHPGEGSHCTACQLSSRFTGLSRPEQLSKYLHRPMIVSAVFSTSYDRLYQPVFSRGTESAEWVQMTKEVYYIGLHSAGQSNKGCLHTGEAENATGAQSTKLDVSSVPIWWRRWGFPMICFSLYVLVGRHMSALGARRGH